MDLKVVHDYGHGGGGLPGSLGGCAREAVRLVG